MDNKNSSNDYQVIVQKSSEGKLTQQITMGTHILIADEPTTAGGNDLGPNPYELLLGALGACTAMTLRFYADFKNIPMRDAIIKLKHERVYEKDCADCENSNAKVDHIQRDIELLGELTDEQKQKLLQVANSCPVHKTLTSKIKITTTLQ